MSLQGKEYQVVFSYLRSLNIHFLDTWVIECVNYYKSLNPNISLEDLKTEVKQQWLLVDLRKIKVPSLPSGLESLHKIMLNGKYAVQVEGMVDCSESCYSQFQKLRKVCTENIEATKEAKEWDIKSNRCLSFVLTDGVQEVQAIEYEPIKKIRTNDPELLPGFKMVIIGPVECRKGMILLKEENVRVYGGEVDTLTSTNTLKSILIKKLDLNEEDYPETLSSGSVGNDTNFIIKSNNELENQERQSVENLLSQNDDVFLSLPLEPEVFTQTQIQEEAKNSPADEKMEVIESGFNDNMFSNVLETINRKHELSQNNVTVSHNSTSVQSNNYVDLMDVDEIEDKLPAQNVKQKFSNLKKPVQTKLSYFFKGNGSPEPNASSSAKRVAKAKSNNPVSVCSEPFVYLKQILETKLKVPVVFTIKGIILTLTKKITIQNDEFNLVASITDGSLTIDVNFCSDILEDFLEFSPCEMIAMMKAKQENSAVADRIKQAFSKAQEKLISLNCLMNIKFFPGDKTPIVLSLDEVNVQHLNTLQNRNLDVSQLL